MWEIRITIATDPITGRAIQRSFTWHGERDDAQARCAELAADYAAHRVIVQAAPFITVGDVLERWLASDHDWRPSTWSSYRSNARGLRADPIAGMRVARLDPPTVRAAIGRWRVAGVTDAVLCGRFRTLTAALGWADQQRLIDGNPLDRMRGPPPPAPRLHAPIADVVALLRHAEQLVDKARADADADPRRCAVSTGPNNCGCSCGSQPTPGLVAANSPPSRSAICRAGCCTSPERRRWNRSGRPRPAARAA